MKFGVFDHMDRGPLPLAEQYENRLKLIEAYDRAGFFCYHLAEHHATPLGMAPSPAVYLSAVAQRSKRMRIGTLVYILSLQNPLRAYEDICMLDQLSGGRLELGIGRGVSPIEIEYYGVNPEESRARYQEALAVLMQGFASDSISFHGKHFRFDDTPVEIKPLQRPHPPLWLGIGSAEGIPHAVNNKINMVCNGQSTQVRALTDRYREEWDKAGHAAKDIPIIGMNRHIVVADTEAEALKVARPAYAAWFRSLILLWERKGVPLPLVGYTADYDEAVRRGFIMVGSPKMVRQMIDAQVAGCGINYLMCRLAFGDLPFECSLRSVDLLTRDVMPSVKYAA
jgi:alkanesulfonate monooxygenase SsuD/methylene tetrahydromethanopterin reductase-like flavin-dependent oxidoreductase (luciferase family)